MFHPLALQKHMILYDIMAQHTNPKVTDRFALVLSNIERFCPSSDFDKLLHCVMVETRDINKTVLFVFA